MSSGAMNPMMAMMGGGAMLPKAAGQVSTVRQPSLIKDTMMAG